MGPPYHFGTWKDNPFLKGENTEIHMKCPLLFSEFINNKRSLAIAEILNIFIRIETRTRLREPEHSLVMNDLLDPNLFTP